MIVLWSVVVEVFAIGRVPLTEVPLYMYNVHVHVEFAFSKHTVLTGKHSTLSGAVFFS